MKMNHKKTRAEFIGWLRLSSAIALLAASSADSADFSYLASLGANQTDNIRRTPTAQESETIGTAGLQFSLGQLTPRLQADVVGNLAYNEYLDNTYDSEVLGNFRADASFALIPQRLEWVFADNFGQVLTDPFAPVTPDNRENINYLSTGPDLTLGLGEATRLQVGGRYALTTYETSPLDSDNITAQLGLIRMLSSSSQVSINARNQSVSYDKVANADYDQTDAYLRYQVAGARTRLALDAGYSRLDSDSASDTEGGALIRLDISRRVSAASIVTLNAGREFMSSGGTFAATQGASIIDLGTTPGRQTVQPFISDHASVGWIFNRFRTGLSLLGTWTDESYRDTPALDQTLATFNGTVQRQLAQNTSLALNTSYTQASFDQPGGDYDEWSAGLSFAWRLSRNLSISAGYTHWDRSSDLPLSNYTENRFSLLFGYGYGQPRTARLPPVFGVDAAANTGL
jgi:hypothetical protein